MSTVSVIVPCYNYGRFLHECVESVLTQVGVDVEVLVVDDASSDETPEVASRLCADSRVTFRRHEENRGHIATYNEGLQWARGDYTLLVSADDVLAPGALARSTVFMDANPGVGLAYGAIVPFRGERAPVTAPAGTGSWRVVPGREWLEARCRDGDHRVYSPTALVRTALQHRLGGYSEQLPRSADMEMWLRFAVHAAVARTDAVQAYYRVHGDNMDRTRFASPLVKLEQTRAAYAAVFQRYAERIPDRERLDAVTRRALARHAVWWILRGVYKRELKTTPVGPLIDFAATTYCRASPVGDHSDLRSKLRLAARVPLLGPPVWDGLVRWPKVWLSVRRGDREPAVP